MTRDQEAYIWHVWALRAAVRLWDHFLERSQELCQSLAGQLALHQGTHSPPHSLPVRVFGLGSPVVPWRTLTTQNRPDRQEKACSCFPVHPRSDTSDPSIPPGQAR